MLSGEDYLRIAEQAFAEADQRATQFMDWAARNSRSSEAQSVIADLLYAKAQAAAALSVAASIPAEKRQQRTVPGFR